MGYSFFPNDLFPVPGSWAGTIANLVHYKQHESGGHFAVSRSIVVFLGMKGHQANSKL
jgi:hypothetical protein